MTGVIDEDEGLLPTTVPVINDGVSQIADCLAEGFEVGVFDLEDIHAACTQPHDSLPHVPGVVFDLVDVLEALVSFMIIAQHVIAPVLNNDPLVVIGSEVCLYHSVFDS